MKQQQLTRVWLMPFLGALLMVVSLFTSLFVTVYNASALDHRGTLYFANAAGTATMYDCPVLSGGYHGGANMANFIARVKQAYNYSDTSGCDGAQDTGAAYIVNTMLQRGPGAPRDLGPTDGPNKGSSWKEWELRLSTVTIADSTVNVLNQINSSTNYDYTADVGQFTDTRDATYATTVFKNSAGHVVYTFKNACGNPIGNNPGIPRPDYALTPTISAGQETGEAGAIVTPANKVVNAGPTASSTVTWRSMVFKLTPSETPVGSSDSSAVAPAAYYGHGATLVTNDSYSFPIGTKDFSLGDQRLGDYDVGDRVCYTLSVYPYRDDDSLWRHSAPSCITIVKKPKTQVLGNDLIVGQGDTVSRIRTSSSRVSVAGVLRSFGSWGEYALSATGEVKGMASGGGYSGGNTSGAFCNVSILTFTNTSPSASVCSTSTALGSYTRNTVQPNITYAFTTNGTIASTQDLSAAAKGVYKAPNTVELSSSSAIPAGKYIVINAPNSTIRIRSNINYTDGAISSVTDIPQVVIIANKITIDAAVTNVDAWLIASGEDGTLNTCSEVSDPNTLNAGKCAQPLLVNGPVIAKHLLLYRTAGAGKQLATGAPAETFNLRPDAYLWATGWSANAGAIQTVSTKELPPRF